MTDLSVVRIDELTTIQITPPSSASDKPSLSVKEGVTYFFSREKPQEMKIETPAANGAMRGTEFVVAVAANGSTTVTMLDGEVELSNAQGSLVISTGEQAKVDVGGRPRKTAVLEAINSVQWCLYYPGVLDLKELGYSRDSNSSASAYNEGDLLAALAAYGHRDGSGSDADRVYHAGLLLAVGQKDKAERLLNAASHGTAGRQALLTLIAAVRPSRCPLSERRTISFRKGSSITSIWFAGSTTPANARAPIARLRRKTLAPKITRRRACPLFLTWSTPGVPTTATNSRYKT
jgi:hypothetical protein